MRKKLLPLSIKLNCEPPGGQGNKGNPAGHLSSRGETFVPSKENYFRDSIIKLLVFSLFCHWFTLISRGSYSAFLSRACKLRPFSGCPTLTLNLTTHLNGAPGDGPVHIVADNEVAIQDCVLLP